MLGYSTGKTRLVKLGYTNSSTSQRHCGCLLGKEQNWQSFSSAPAALDVPTLYCTLYEKQDALPLTPYTTTMQSYWCRLMSQNLLLSKGSSTCLTINNTEKWNNFWYTLGGKHLESSAIEKSDFPIFATCTHTRSSLLRPGDFCLAWTCTQRAHKSWLTRDV